MPWNFVWSLTLVLHCHFLFYFQIPTFLVFLITFPFPLFSLQCHFLSFHYNHSDTLFCVQGWTVLSQLELVAPFMCLPDVSREAIGIPPWQAALLHLRTTCWCSLAASLFVFLATFPALFTNQNSHIYIYMVLSLTHVCGRTFQQVSPPILWVLWILVVAITGPYLP